MRGGAPGGAPDAGSVAVAQLGARMHYAVPRILQEAGLLDRLFTDVCAVKGWPSLLRRLVARDLQPQELRRLLGRVPEGVPPSRITAFTAFGLEYALRLRRARNTSESTATYLWGGERFNALVVGHGLGKARVLYGYNGASSGLFEEGRRRGLKLILEQTIAPYEVEARILSRDDSLQAGWRQASAEGDAAGLIAREEREWALADMILCGSDFVREGVVSCGASPAKCVVVPYGVDLRRYHSLAGQSERREEHFKVLFMGGVGLRKGVPYLFEAMGKLAGLPIRCRVVGPFLVQEGFLRAQNPPNVELVGPVPRDGAVEEYRRADAFCLPSLCEGSATVTYEALAAGLPVITTANSGSIVRDGVEGLIVPAQDASALASAIERLYRDRPLRLQMSGAALQRSDYGSFAAYSRRLLAAVESLGIR